MQRKFPSARREHETTAENSKENARNDKLPEECDLQSEVEGILVFFLRLFLSQASRVGEPKRFSSSIGKIGA